MDNKIEIFKNEQFGEVRTILEGEKVLFCAADVAKALGYTNPNKAVNDHCRAITKRSTPISGKVQSINFIPEGDVYRLIIRSKLPAAEKFELWVFEEVIPTIRKTGGYMTDSLLERIQKEPAVIVEFAQALILEKNRVKALECELNTAKPKADYYDAFINPDDCTNIRTTAKELKIPERKFVQFLLREKYLFRSPSGQLLPYNKLEHKADVADAKLQYERNQQEHPEMKKQNMNKHYQKQNIKKEYAAARNAGSQTAGTATKNTGKKLGEKASDKIKEFFEKNKKVFIWIGVGVALLVLLGAGISSCSMLTSTGSSVIASSYLSEDDAMLGAEAQYYQMEQELQRYLDTYESTHNYDEYHFDLDDIEHDPYVLISILSALHEGEFTLDEVQGTLQMLFEKQYILTEEVIVETRYRTETDTWTDADGNTHTETYRVPYDYYICNVKLENFNLSHVPVYIMSQEQLSMYATYMSVLGNREDLFGDSPYVDKYITNPPADYDVNPEYLNDEKFATLITEAEKYLGYPYVWGGSNPDTSFDCSGFVSYVLTNSGLVNTGRLGAQGLYNVCTPVSKANAQPGDLIFFVGTYDTPGVSHVGIYVGDGVMIHCGDPIQYTSINSSYWQQHFYAFGRPAY